MNNENLKKNPAYSLVELIADMSLNGATMDELATVIRYSVVFIRATKKCLDTTGYEEVYGIDALRKKYQPEL
jgi:hypothetical protein